MVHVLYMYISYKAYGYNLERSSNFLRSVSGSGHACLPKLWDDRDCLLFRDPIRRELPPEEWKMAKTGFPTWCLVLKQQAAGEETA